MACVAIGLVCLYMCIVLSGIIFVMFLDAYTKQVCADVQQAADTLSLAVPKLYNTYTCKEKTSSRSPGASKVMLQGRKNPHHLRLPAIHSPGAEQQHGNGVDYARFAVQHNCRPRSLQDNVHLKNCATIVICLSNNLAVVRQ